RYADADSMSADLELLQCDQSVRRKRVTRRRERIVKKFCIAVILLALTSAALIILVRQISPSASNAAHRLSKNPLANVEYWEGVSCSSRFNKEGLAQGLAHFTNAVALDPIFTMAYNGIFEVYMGGEILGLSDLEKATKLRAFASQLMRLDRKLAEAHAAQAWLDFTEWKWESAERRFLRALELNPKCAIALIRCWFCF